LQDFSGFYLIHKKNNSSNNPSDSKNLFPFGATTPTNGQPAAGGNVDATGTRYRMTGTPIATTNAERLRQITQYPITNFFASVAQKALNQNLMRKLDKPA
jgi:hypothetical protein